MFLYRCIITEGTKVDDDNSAMKNEGGNVKNAVVKMTNVKMQMIMKDICVTVRGGAAITKDISYYKLEFEWDVKLKGSSI